MSEARENQANGTYDVVVLGAGPVGQNVADRARAAYPRRRRRGT